MRHRMSVLAVVSVAVGAFLVAVSPQATAAPPGCADLYFIAVAGSGELANLPKKSSDTQLMGNMLTPLYRGLADYYKKSKTTLRGAGLPYPAVALTPSPDLPSEYMASVAAGESALNNRLIVSAQQCPGQQFLLAGYSQGAHVVDNVVRFLAPALRARIRAKVTFGDPLFNRANVDNVSHDGKSLTRNGVLAGLLSPTPVDPPDMATRSRNYCDSFDFVCQGFGTFLSHEQYGEWAIPQARQFITGLEVRSARCAISTATYTADPLTFTTTTQGRGVALVGGGIQGIPPTAAVNAGWRLIDLIAAGPDGVRIDQPSLASPDTPQGLNQNVAAPGELVFVLARAVKQGCATPATLTYTPESITRFAASVTGRLSAKGEPLGSRVVVWQARETSNASSTFRCVTRCLGQTTQASGDWRLTTPASPKPLFDVGTYTTRLVFPGDLNSEPAVSKVVTVTLG